MEHENSEIKGKTKNPIAIYAPNPEGLIFDSQEKGEKIILLLRAHPITFVPSELKTGEPLLPGRLRGLKIKYNLLIDLILPKKPLAHCPPGHPEEKTIAFDFKKTSSLAQGIMFGLAFFPNAFLSSRIVAKSLYELRVPSYKFTKSTF